MRLQLRWLMYRRSLQVRWLMYLRWRRRRCKIQARNGPITVWDRRNGSPCQQDYTTQIGETKGYSWTYLPEEILRHIHSLMPLRDAARAACVCRAFLCSWRSFPNLTFSNQTLGLNENARGKDEIARDFTNKVDQIMKNHLGTGVKTLKLLDAPNYNRRYNRCLDSWLEKAVTPGIEELTLAVAGHFVAKSYKFPCSVLSCGNGDSIRHISLEECAFRPTDGEEHRNARHSSVDAPRGYWSVRRMMVKTLQHYGQTAIVFNSWQNNEQERSGVQPSINSSH